MQTTCPLKTLFDLIDIQAAYKQDKFVEQMMAVNNAQWNKIHNYFLRKQDLVGKIDCQLADHPCRAAIVGLTDAANPDYVNKQRLIYDAVCVEINNLPDHNYEAHCKTIDDKYSIVVKALKYYKK